MVQPWESGGADWLAQRLRLYDFEKAGSWNNTIAENIGASRQYVTHLRKCCRWETVLKRRFLACATGENGIKSTQWLDCMEWLLCGGFYFILCARNPDPSPARLWSRSLLYKGALIKTMAIIELGAKHLKLITKHNGQGFLSTFLIIFFPAFR